MAGVETAAGKAGRNEARKLHAGWFNTISAAFFIGAVLQPTLIMVQQQRFFTLAEAGATAIFLIVSRVLFTRAQLIASNMED